MRRLRALLLGLPPDARLTRENPDEPLWDAQHELTAQLIEEVSVLAADYRRKEPRKVNRPYDVTPTASTGSSATSNGAQQGVTLQGFDAILGFMAGRTGTAVAYVPEVDGGESGG